jgi:hypothetical protein
VAPNTPAPAPAVPPAPTTYKIGDTGPAGGIIFYDKGSNSGGWRYLEAAPKEAETKEKWGGFRRTVSGTNADLGAGKRNTELIVNFMWGIGEYISAAQYCADLDFGGFDDWLLPGKNELNLMYANLRRKGLGGFSGGYYWSSSGSNSNHAWAQGFSNGHQDGDGNNYAREEIYSVRAVRAF